MQASKCKLRIAQWSWNGVKLIWWDFMTTIWLKPSRQDMQDMVAGRTVSRDAGGTREDSHQTSAGEDQKKCQTWGPQIAWSRMSRMHGHPLAGMLVGVRLDQLKGLVPAKSHALPKRVQRSCLPVSFLPFFPTCVSCMCILGELDIAVVNWTCRSFFEAIHKQEKPTCTDPCLNNRRKFRSQTSDNMDRWKAEQGRGREKRKMRRKKSRRERVRRKKMQMREKVGKSRNTVFSNDLGLRRVEK